MARAGADSIADTRRARSLAPPVRGGDRARARLPAWERLPSSQWSDRCGPGVEPDRGAESNDSAVLLWEGLAPHTTGGYLGGFHTRARKVPYPPPAVRRTSALSRPGYPRPRAGLRDPGARIRAGVRHRRPHHLPDHRAGTAAGRADRRSQPDP